MQAFETFDELKRAAWKHQNAQHHVSVMSTIISGANLWSRSAQGLAFTTGLWFIIGLLIFPARTWFSGLLFLFAGVVFLALIGAHIEIHARRDSPPIKYSDALIGYLNDLLEAHAARLLGESSFAQQAMRKLQAMHAKLSTIIESRRRRMSLDGIQPQVARRDRLQDDIKNLRQEILTMSAFFKDARLRLEKITPALRSIEHLEQAAAVHGHVKDTYADVEGDILDEINDMLARLTVQMNALESVSRVVRNSLTEDARTQPALT